MHGGPGNQRPASCSLLWSDLDPAPLGLGGGSGGWGGGGRRQRGFGWFGRFQGRFLIINLDMVALGLVYESSEAPPTKCYSYMSSKIVAVSTQM